MSSDSWPAYARCGPAVAREVKVDVVVPVMGEEGDAGVARLAGYRAVHGLPAHAAPVRLGQRIRQRSTRPGCVRRLGRPLGTGRTNATSERDDWATGELP
jgi:hypothetical protein